MIYAILSLMLLVSVSINVFLVWFAWKSLRQITEYDEELREISLIMQRFTNHLKGVYELEAFYGDETLRHLLRHSVDIINVFESYDLLLRDEEDDDYSDHFEES